MKKLYLLFWLFFAVSVAQAQLKTIDTLRYALNKAQDDTTRLKALAKLSQSYFISNPDSCIILAQQAYPLAVKYNRAKEQASLLNIMANAYATIGDYVKGMQFYFKALRTFQNINYTPGVVQVYNNIGATYVQEQDYKNALIYLQLANKQWGNYMASHQLLTSGEKKQRAILFINIGECFLYTHKIDSAEYYLLAGYQDAMKKHFTDLINNMERDLGEVETAKGNKTAALKYYRDAIRLSITNEDVEMLSITYLSTANLYHKYKQQDSAEYYAKKAFDTARAGKYEQDVLNAGKELNAYYDEDHNLPEAYKYYKLTTAAKDSLYSQDRVKQLLSMDFDEKQRQQDIAAAQLEYRDQVRTYILIAGLMILLLLVFVFWRNSRQRQEANLRLQKQKEDVQAALSQLQLTQKQLIQSEKMASLGELTAGIAHEIQNPLNFVNNFSEISIELLDELKAGPIQKLPNTEKANADEIINDLTQNLEKINHHGKRADAIVKGMLQHSRASSATKEPADINKIADEYIRLAYHGLRARDKSFNAELVTKFDTALPLVNVVPQDIGRVLLNLFTNAFYAVNQKAKTAGPDYKPTVTVTTFAPPSGGWGVMVKDNGNGIPEAIKDKIMQPFFTTKPTGEGTGLGLSLSYDIVVKGHGGVIEINSKEKQGSEFIIRLPIS